ncbi:hypothetical protein ABFV51_10575 [Pseudomonas asgharzadehiana]|uniref:hypothetical protein n=1 Tax=Pseudomonas asgharzadehiana TaxID=2842349 RepID=UPI0034D609BA
MSVEANPGVTYLIEQANKTSVDAKLQPIYAALAEAGGVAALQYLISVANKTSVQAKLEPLYALIGRASRT